MGERLLMCAPHIISVNLMAINAMSHTMLFCAHIDAFAHTQPDAQMNSQCTIGHRQCSFSRFSSAASWIGNVWLFSCAAVREKKRPWHPLTLVRPQLFDITLTIIRRCKSRDERFARWQNELGIAFTSRRLQAHRVPFHPIRFQAQETKRSICEWVWMIMSYSYKWNYWMRLSRVVRLWLVCRYVDGWIRNRKSIHSPQNVYRILMSHTINASSWGGQPRFTLALVDGINRDWW